MRQGRHRDEALAVDGEPLATRRQNDDVLGHLDELFGNPGRFIDHVLTVVEDDTAVLVAQHLDQSIDVGLVGPALHAQPLR